jgi:hypothetical protein
MVIASHKRKIIKPWAPEMSYCKAYCGNHLRKNDYSVINSYVVTHILIIVMAVCICIAEESLVGIPICSVFIHLMWTDMALASNLKTSRSMNLLETIMLFASYVLHYGISIWYLTHAWDWDAMTHDLLGEFDLKDEEETSATYYFVFFIVLIPFISASNSARNKYIDDRESRVDLMSSRIFLALFALCIIQGIGIVVCTGLMLDTGTAFGIGGAGIFLIYIFVAFTIYKKRDYSWPTPLIVTNTILFGGIFIAVIAVAGFSPTFSKYAAVSMAMLIGAIMLGIFSGILFNRDE